MTLSDIIAKFKTQCEALKCNLDSYARFRDKSIAIFASLDDLFYAPKKLEENNLLQGRREMVTDILSQFEEAVTLFTGQLTAMADTYKSKGEDASAIDYYQHYLKELVENFVKEAESQYINTLADKTLKDSSAEVLTKIKSHFSDLLEQKPTYSYGKG